MKVVIIGQGVWGKALEHVLKQNTKDVSFWDMKESVIKAELIVLAVPAQALREVLQKLSFAHKDVVVINTSKGIEKDSHLLPFQIVQEVLPRSIAYGSLIGPSFAGEVTKGMPTLVNIGIDEKIDPAILDIFQTPVFHTRVIKGFEALELAGAFKNIYAIACGMADGLGFGMNTRIELMMLAIDELYDLCHALGYAVDRYSMPGTIGDLLLSCSSIESRNYSLGKLLITNSLEESLVKINSTVEGKETAQSVTYFNDLSPLPLADFVLQALGAKEGAANLFSAFIAAPK